MADNMDAVDQEIEQEDLANATPKVKKHDSGAADLERVTDYAEEAEISSALTVAAIAALDDKLAKEKKAKAEREKELAKVVIRKEDVDLIVNELEISRPAAEKSLREHKGHLVSSLITLTN
ncbi:huntingtin-interacting protein K-like [Anneissia japonica]|uniref:huntingtin-interacting protein K-like n=1 Tax=Anneissia japonica TaxID=1529436 RepID=UPI00142587FD|nr:huntingtin-interacting protein K-like [Anneissia japonica]